MIVRRRANKPITQIVTPNPTNWTLTGEGTALVQGGGTDLYFPPTNSSTDDGVISVASYTGDATYEFDLEVLDDVSVNSHTCGVTLSSADGWNLIRVFRQKGLTTSVANTGTRVDGGYSAGYSDTTTNPILSFRVVVDMTAFTAAVSYFDTSWVLLNTHNIAGMTDFNFNIKVWRSNSSGSDTDSLILGNITVNAVPLNFD